MLGACSAEVKSAASRDGRRPLANVRQAALTAGTSPLGNVTVKVAPPSGLL
jgi:hypothetical protein